MVLTKAEERVIARLNQQLGSGAEALHRSRDLVDEYSNRLQELRSKITLDQNADATTNQPSSTFQASVRSIETTHAAIDIQLTKIDHYQSTITQRLDVYESHLARVAEPVQRIDRLELMTEYLRVVQEIRDISAALALEKDDERLVGLYLSLCGGELDSAGGAVMGRLKYVEAKHLKAFAEKTAVYWYNVLVEKLSKDFEACLKSIKWPSMGSSAEVFAPNKLASHKLTTIAEYLFLIKYPRDSGSEYVAITPAVLCPPISMPTQLLLRPFRQRFQYHFSGAKQTNRLDKPEWFYTQVLAWARDNHAFVGETFQVAANLAGLRETNVRIEFIRGLVQLAMEKLATDVEEIAGDEHLFAHLLDETLSFEQELRETFRYPVAFPSALSVLTQPQYLMKWLQAEENFSMSQLDVIMTRGTPWEFIDPINLEELKIPKCTDQFVRLLDAIKERYCVLSQPGHQMQFLNLQLVLIDSFRRRLVQLHSSVETHVSSTKVLNAIHYLVSVLREWGESVHYLHLHVAQFGQLSELGRGDEVIDDVTSVFERPIAEFEHWHAQIAADLAGKIVDDIKAKSMSYRRESGWVTMPALASTQSFALSATAGEMFQLMVAALHELETELSVSILRHVLRIIASRFDVFVIDGMLMNTRFSPGGCAQFNFDMTRNLFPLFGQYLARPHLLFKRIHDACILFTLPIGSALLLYDTLKRSDGDEAKATLHELGVVTLTARMARNLLERRTDIGTN